MKIEGKFLNSRLGRRLFTIFCLCALVPLTLTAFVTFTQVKKQLKEQSRQSLMQASKTLGMSVYERMILLSSELKRAGSVLQNLPPEEFTSWNDLDNMFIAILFKDTSGTTNTLLKTENFEPVPEQYTKIIKNTDKPFIFTQKTASPLSRVFIAFPVKTENNNPGIIIGEINTAFLWKIGSANILPPKTDLIVIDQNKNIIVSSVKKPDKCINKMPSGLKEKGSRQFEWSDNKNEYLARYWNIFMESRFNSNSWTVILSQSKNDLFASVNIFQQIFPLIIILSFLIVIFLSMVNIRLILDPLEKLKAGIREIARSNFKTRINIKSHDEFEEVAEAFNNMSTQLGRQFRALHTNSEIDRAILSSLEPEVIINKMLSGIQELLFCSSAAINLADHENRSKAVCHMFSNSDEKEFSAKTIFFDADDIESRLKGQDYLWVRSTDNAPGYLRPFNNSTDYWIIIPVFIQNRIEATLNLGYQSDTADINEDLRHAGQMADQMGVALANSNLVRELDHLNDGALTALARTVDAKSPWTAGHSERVSKMAQMLAEILELEQSRIDILYRAALLHDIGKVGIPGSILNKPGKLTDDEYALIKDHPSMGARILEPIKVYKEVIPIVRQHHEQFSGNGYPDGLAGEKIVLEARIMAVADVYDALISDRPYRDGWEFKNVVAFIKENSGSHFDPRVVKAFEYLTETWNENML
ncbi:MAG: HD domain-containing phosphohydrolase [Thermodesulfobacteriota bacterium]